MNNNRRLANALIARYERRHGRIVRRDVCASTLDVVNDLEPMWARFTLEDRFDYVLCTPEDEAWARQVGIAL